MAEAGWGRPHHDNLPLDLGAVVYLGRVGRLDGGYTVPPGARGAPPGALTGDFTWVTPESPSAAATGPYNIILYDGRDRERRPKGAC